MLELVDYCVEHRNCWDDIVDQADNGHFMFKRSYMEYHADRFSDASFVILNKGRPVGVCPGNQVGQEWQSHGGLTFGGLCLRPKFNRVKNIDDIYGKLKTVLYSRGYKHVHVRPVPWIYHKSPAEGEIYFLNRSAQSSCVIEVSTTIDLKNTLKASSSREWMKRKAISVGFQVESSHDFEGFWDVLAGRLKEKYDQNPVHSVAEIKFLANQFPQNIQLFVVRDTIGDVVGGTVLFLNEHVAHTQYLAASDEGMKDGALDLLIFHLIDSQRNANRQYFDFGISNEQNGKVLNSSLATFKEGFGGRSIIHHKFDFDL
ncbi:GNAT family N-acetyltransferase [Thalassospira sp. MA62]|nr:GNAT family N-acetyltransferase [Thalassospira sp. MA62]